MRYTALFSGVFYGWLHRRTLQAAYDKHKLEEAAHHREKLVVEAKDAWKRKHEIANDTTSKFFYLLAFSPYCLGQPVITDPDNPRFDLEKLISKLEKSS